MSALQELLAWAEYKQSAAAQIREAADAVSSRALALEMKFDDEVDTLTAAIALLDREAESTDENDAEIAELEALAAEVSIEIGEDEGGAESEGPAGSDTPTDDSDITAEEVASFERGIKKAWGGDEAADNESE